jgi:hypothetical protein
MAGHQRTADTPAGGGQADTPAGGGQADRGGRYTTDRHTFLRYGGKGGTVRREPQRGGRERCININTGHRDPRTIFVHLKCPKEQLF